MSSVCRGQFVNLTWEDIEFVSLARYVDCKFISLLLLHNNNKYWEMTSIHCISLFSSSCAAIIFARSTFHINRGSRKRDRWFMILEQSGDIIIETNIITGYWAARSHASQTIYRSQNIGNHIFRYSTV